MMEQNEFENLPDCARDYIDLVVKKIRYRRKVRDEVRAELLGHFVDGLADCEDAKDRECVAEKKVTGFGDIKMLGNLIKRGKKRCRPLWLKMLIGTMQVAGILLLCVIARGAYLSIGTPVISVDYVQWMNEHVRGGRSDDLNALPYYERAVELSKEVPNELKDVFGGLLPEQFTSEQWDALEEFLARDAEALDTLRQGAAKPHYWNVYEGKSSQGRIPDMAAQVTGVIMPSMTGYKKLMQKVAFLQIPWSLHIGDIERATDDSIVLHRFAQHMSGQGLLIEQLVGIALEAIAHAETFEIIDNFDISAEKLENMQKQLEEIYSNEAIIDLETEKSFLYDFIQCTFTDDGKGSGRAMKQGVALAAGDLQSVLKGFVAGYPDRREVTASVDRYFERIGQLANQTPWQLAQAGWNDAKWNELAGNHLLLNPVSPGFRKSTEIAWRVRASRSALLTVLAVKRYEKANKAYPASLDELVGAGYLKKLPNDPYSDGALRYKVVGNDFVLYSFGVDMKDDGGRMGTKNGKPFKWSDYGDWVFWPVE
ncbi:MAG: hypothetical protein J7M40_15585 [Planctomycetes bacterium]|nr:hypothetical protein [Planctomycetota bacterium]